MAIETEVKLFSAYFSPFAQRVLIALREKGIPFDLVEVNIPYSKPDELLEANPIHKKVPTLVHDGKAVAESLVILQYLEDAWPQKVNLMPGDAYRKSQLRFWADYTYQFSAKVLSNLFNKLGSPETAAASKVTADGLKTLEEAMLSFSAEGPFFAGEKFGYMDVVLAPLVVLLAMQEQICGFNVPNADELPRFNKWLEVVKARPSVQDSLPSIDTSIATFKRLSERRAKLAAEAEAAAAAKK